MALRQGGMGVEEYFEKFTALSQFAPELVATESARVSKFKMGLNQSIQNALSPFTREITTLRDLYEKAANVYSVNHPVDGGSHQKRERGDSSGSYKGKGKWQANRGTMAGRGNQGPQWTANRPPVRAPMGGPPPRNSCSRCGGFHPTTDCEGCPIVCYNCQKSGHRANSCPHPRGNRGGRPKLQPGGRGWLNVITAEEAASEGDVITGTFSVYNFPARVVFDSGASCSLSPLCMLDAMVFTVCDTHFRGCGLTLGSYYPLF